MKTNTTGEMVGEIDNVYMKTKDISDDGYITETTTKYYKKSSTKPQTNTIEEMVEEFEKSICKGFIANETEQSHSHDWLKQTITKAKEQGAREYKQFILNILDGVDIADGGCNTKAIRMAIESRIITPQE